MDKKIYTNLKSPSSLPRLQVPVFRPMDLMVEASPRRVFSNAHTYHINSISVNSDCETYLSADDLRVNLWNLEISDRSFSILSCVVALLVFEICFCLLLIHLLKMLIDPFLSGWGSLTYLKLLPLKFFFVQHSTCFYLVNFVCKAIALNSTAFRYR